MMIRVHKCAVERLARDGNEVYLIGVVDVPDAIAARLVSNGQAERVSDIQAIEQKAGISDDRLSDLVDAIDSLEGDNHEHWTNAGKPEVSALKRVTGGDVTAAERDAAWAYYQSIAG